MPKKYHSFCTLAFLKKERRSRLSFFAHRTEMGCGGTAFRVRKLTLYDKLRLGKGAA